MLVSLRGAASLWIKDVSTKMKTYTVIYDKSLVCMMLVLQAMGINEIIQ